MQLARRWWGDRAGATVVEYGVIAAIMAALILSAFSGVFTAIVGVLTRIKDVL